MHRRTLLKTGVATTAGGLAGPLLAGAEAVPTAGAQGSPLAASAPGVDRVLARGLQVPWGLAFLPNGSALVGERDRGRVLRVGPGGSVRAVGVLPSASQRGSGGEGGLLGLAVAPTFATDRWVYAYLTTASDNRIVRVRYDGGQLQLRTLQVLLAGIPQATHHNGGRLRFSPGGLLYVGTGDAERGARAQSTRSLGGKILRLAPDGSVPDGNPFGNHVWSFGHRNVEGLAFDRRGRLWASELGEHRRDELNRIVRGGNYGWPGAEGSDGPGGYRDPFVSWATSECSPSGVAVAGGWAYVGALRGESLWAVRIAGTNRRRKVRYFSGRFGRIRTVEKAPDGTLWITTSNRDGRHAAGAGDDRVIRLRLA